MLKTAHDYITEARQEMNSSEMNESMSKPMELNKRSASKELDNLAVSIGNFQESMEMTLDAKLSSGDQRKAQQVLGDFEKATDALLTSIDNFIKLI